MHQVRANAVIYLGDPSLLVGTGLQVQAFAVERSALEGGAASLAELNSELSGQLEVAQRAAAAAAAARVAAVDAEMHARQDAEAARAVAVEAEAQAATRAAEAERSAKVL
jgi:hypothetical protein